MKHVLGRLLHLKNVAVTHMLTKANKLATVSGLKLGGNTGR
jgi:hypothetical protein